MSLRTVKLPSTLEANRQLDRWVQFNNDGTVTLRTGKVEIGQGIVSAIAQIAAEELDISYAQIRMFPVDTTISPDEKSTSGSRSIQEGGEAMRQACAEIRNLLLNAAARKLKLDVANLFVENGRIHALGHQESLSYWQVAQEADLSCDACGRVGPKSPTQFKLVGSVLPRLDLPGKIVGGGFIQDIELPGMLHGRIIRPPSYRAKLISVDDAAIRRMVGIRAIVREGSFLGIVAEREEQAIKAMNKLSLACQWSEKSDLPDMSDLPDYLCGQPAEVEYLSDESDQTPILGKRLLATYTRPYLAHASIGPSCGLAWWHEGKLEVWSHSQSIYALRDAIANILKLSPTAVIARHAEGSGCYGHNGADDAAFDAALLARAVDGHPVRVQWMREDEFAWEPFGPAMVVKLEGSVDESGRITDWNEDIWGNRHISRPGRYPAPGLLAALHFDQGYEMPPAADMPISMGGGSQRNAVPYYDFQNQRVTNHAVTTQPIRTSALRALGAYINIFAIESFMDELAGAAGADPVEFRLRHLKDERARAVIKAAAEKAGWQAGHKGNGSHGVGFAFARYKNIGNYVAVIAEVSIGETVRVTRVVSAVDCGCIVNPDGVLNQCEGGIVQATSWALKEEVRFDKNRITTRTWDDYPILTFSEVPKIEVVLIDRPHEESLGVGEGMTGPTAAAIGNAIFNAMGVRVRDLPLNHEHIVAAMEQ